MSEHHHDNSSIDSQTSARWKRSYKVSEVAPYINWLYFYHAWQVGPGQERDNLRADAEHMLQTLDKAYCTHAVMALYPACSDHDDIVLGDLRIPCLRQQRPDADGFCLSLADFVRPATIDSQTASTEEGVLEASADNADRVGVFATTVDTAMETDLKSDAYERMLSQTLADRLAEATAEMAHQEMRRCLWGYAPNENLSLTQLLHGDYQGIRPAVGYPSLPDTSVNFLLERLLRMSEIGIRLTETGAMRPHASVSGLMLAHPAARYFDLGKIDETQLADYARRRGVPIELMRRFLSSSLIG